MPNALRDLQQRFARLRPLDLADARLRLAQAFAETSPRIPQGVSVFDLAGLESLDARVYVPDALSSLDPRPTIFFVHGGGFWCMSPENYDGVLGQLAVSAHAQIIAPRYPLAPEHPFPAAPRHISKAYKALAAHRVHLKLDAARLAVVGESAGGNLAATLIPVFGEAGCIPRVQVLVHPLLDLAGMQPSRLASTPIVSNAAIRASIDRYLAGANPLDPEASPLYSNELHKAPPTVIVAGSLDPVLDECRVYAKRLSDADVPVTFLVADGLPHGFLQLAGSLGSGMDMLRALGAVIAGRLEDRDIA